MPGNRFGSMLKGKRRFGGSMEVALSKLLPLRWRTIEISAPERVVRDLVLKPIVLKTMIVIRENDIYSDRV